MINAFAEGLIARGVPHFDIFRELFAAPNGTLADDCKTYSVTFSRSHKTNLVGHRVTARFSTSARPKGSPYRVGAELVSTKVARSTLSRVACAI